MEQGNKDGGNGEPGRGKRGTDPVSRSSLLAWSGRVISRTQLAGGIAAGSALALALARERRLRDRSEAILIARAA